MTESWNSAVHDSGSPKIVCGHGWYDAFLESMTDKDFHKVRTSPTRCAFCFGDGDKVIPQESSRIPATLGNKKGAIQTDIIEKDIPLLLSRTET